MGSLGVRVGSLGVRVGSLGVRVDSLGVRLGSLGVRVDSLGVRVDGWSAGRGALCMGRCLGLCQLICMCGCPGMGLCEFCLCHLICLCQLICLCHLICLCGFQGIRLRLGSHLGHLEPFMVDNRLGHRALMRHGAMVVQPLFVLLEIQVLLKGNLTHRRSTSVLPCRSRYLVLSRILRVLRPHPEATYAGKCSCTSFAFIFSLRKS